jgi:hypothetical protein
VSKIKLGGREVAKLYERYVFRNPDDMNLFIGELGRNKDKLKSFNKSGVSDVDVFFHFPHGYRKELHFVRALAEFYNGE